MGRIRTIKPEFPQSESMGRISRDARLTFIELWTISDDKGRTRGNTRMLASLLFPYDDDAPSKIGTWLAELESESCIMRYEVDGQSYIQICNWLSHQKIEKPTPSKIPAPQDNSANPPRQFGESSPNPPRILDDSSGWDWKGKEGIGEEHSVVASATTPVDNFSESEPWPAFDAVDQLEQPAPTPEPVPPHQQACDLASKLHTKAAGSKPTIDGGVKKTFIRLIQDHGLELVLSRLENYYLEPHWFTDKSKGNAYSLKGFFGHFDELCQAPKPKQPAKPNPAQKCPKCGAEKIPYIDLCKCREWDFKSAAEITKADWDKAFRLPKGKAG